MLGELYLSSRATRVCLAFARPRPIGSTPSLRSAGAQLRAGRPAWRPRLSDYVSDNLTTRIERRAHVPPPRVVHRPTACCGARSLSAAGGWSASRPTDRMRCSASRSAATAGDTPSASASSNTRRATSKMLLALALRAVEREAVPLVLDLDDAAGVHQVVRRVEDAALDQLLGHVRGGELVVRAAADDAGGQHRHGLLVEGAAERAGRVDVVRGADQRRGVGDGADLRVARLHPLDRRRVDVGDDDVGAVLDQVADQPRADLADAGDGDRAAGQRRACPSSAGRRPACPGRRRRR